MNKKELAALKSKLTKMGWIARLLLAQRREMTEIYIIGLSDLIKAMDKAIDMREFAESVTNMEEITELMKEHKGEIKVMVDGAISDLIQALNDDTEQYYDLDTALTHAKVKEIGKTLKVIAEIEPALTKADELFGVPYILKT